MASSSLRIIRTFTQSSTTRSIAVKPDWATSKMKYLISVKPKYFSTKTLHGINIKQEVMKATTSNAENEAVTSVSMNQSPSLPLAEVTSLPVTMQRFCLLGNVVVVTGGGRGLGYNMAEALCQVGCKAIALLDYNQDDGEAAVAKLTNTYAIPAVCYNVDVRDPEAVDDAMAKVALKFGTINVLICSAGIADSNLKAETYDPKMFRNLIDINLNGTMFCAQAAGRVMIKNNTPGSIIFIGSMSGSIVNWPQEQCAYNASKAGVIQLAKSLAAEWATYNIRVNSISPGYMDTELNRVPKLDGQKKLWRSRTPMGRLGAPDELNNLAVYLASEGSNFMTGADIKIDGGYCVW